MKGKRQVRLEGDVPMRWICFSAVTARWSAYEAEILDLKGEIEVANASVAALVKDLSGGNSSPSKPRRKADRSATQELQQVIKEPHPQADNNMSDEMLDENDMSDEMLSENDMSDEMLDTVSPRQGQASTDELDYDPHDIPPTPVKKTATFASGSSSTYFGSQRTSPPKTRPSYHESRIVEDSQDRAATLRQPSFETPSYPSSKNHSQRQPETLREPLPTSSLPRSALKSSNSASKRSTTTAGLADQGGESKRNRRGLGPV